MTTATAPLLAPQTSFYKRPLPSTCIAFNSDEGRKLFAEGLAEGNMRTYFLLAGALEMQQDPAYCGLGTLTSILNALEVDPHRKWRGAWRYYDQSMLDCCRPLSDVAAVGITLSEFTCLARCNGLQAKVVSPLLDSTPEKRTEAVKRFREDVKSVARGKGAMAISYSRKVLGQTGSGHFSPLGGYCEKEDKLLILDVARFKYPSHWVPLELAWEAMLPIDDATGQPRGYVMLDVAGNEPGSLAAPLSLTSLALNKSTWSSLSQSLSRLLLQSSKSSPTASALLDLVLSHFSTLATSPIAPRPVKDPSAASPLPPLLDALSSTRYAASTSFATSVNPNSILLQLLLILALFSPRSSLATLLPPSAAADLRAQMDEALALPGVRDEVEILTKQLGALGECCRGEEEGGAACGCTGGPKV
ncbi:hypothetical protein JCM10207_000100 [Rhodosporidiobolus poonsookiae]